MTNTDETLIAKLDEIARTHADLVAQLEDPEVLSDHTKVRALSIKRSALDDVVSSYSEYKALLSEADDLREALVGDDDELAQMAREELPGVERRAAESIEAIKRELVTSDERSIGSVILEVRAGTGGDEAGLWARDLLGVYARYAQSKGWSVEELELDTEPSVGGVRHAVVNIRGEGVFQRLGFEAGVHSVKRVPATETQGRIHTSTCTVAVLPEPEDVDVSIDWNKDVVEHITTAQGPGGQNVNKVATAVQLIHEPTGIEVRMQESKSQLANREKARRLLMARVYELERAKAAQERDAARRDQIGTGQRSEKIRVYRYQDNIVSDQRLSEKYQTNKVMDDADLDPMIDALIERDVVAKLAAL